MKYSQSFAWLVCVCSLSSPVVVDNALADSAPPLALAGSYAETVNLSHYLISEKYDGARAWWDGRRFVTRGGNVYQAPAWFTQHLPDQTLDGELWIGRGQFQPLMQTIRDTVPDDDAWRAVRFMVFDAPDAAGGFRERQRQLRRVLSNVKSGWVQQVEQVQITGHRQLQQRLADIVAEGGEGLILQHADLPYRAGRHAGMLKMTPYQDAEATVTAHIDGNGKYQGLTGSLLVIDSDGQRFKLGSGLSDSDRHSPPPIGSVVTYRYRGRTRSGKPRFARFLRRRPAE